MMHMDMELKERYGRHTKLSPLSLVIFAGRPAGRACSKTAVSPLRAASYMRLAKAMTSGDSRDGWICWSPMVARNWLPLMRRGVLY